MVSNLLSQACVTNPFQPRAPCTRPLGAGGSNPICADVLPDAFYLTSMVSGVKRAATLAVERCLLPGRRAKNAEADQRIGQVRQPLEQAARRS